MAAYKIDKQTVEHAVYGGVILGGGGGGWVKDGLQIGNLALELGDPTILSADQLKDEDLLVTVSLVGAPAAKEKYLKPVHYLRAIDLLQEKLQQPIKGIITNENGANGTVNGWLQSALLNIPVIDLPCNGRAHPTGTMGSLNLTEQPSYQSIQTAVGGKGTRYVETVVTGSLDTASTLVRKASIEAGGLVAVARNPIQAGYAKQHGAPGGILQAIQAGEALRSQTGAKAIAAVADKLGGKVVAEGTVTDFVMETKDGFDVGTVTIEKSLHMTFWNEFMTLEMNGDRLATFPDLIMTFDTETGEPIVSGAIQEGQKLAILTVPKDKLILSSTMFNVKLLQTIENILDERIINYL